MALLPVHQQPQDDGMSTMASSRQPLSGTPLSSTPRSTIGRHRERAVLDRGALWSVLDDGVVAHLGLVIDGAPVVLPTIYGRAGDTVYLHGSTGARSLRLAAGGSPVCLTVTHVDGIVYARSVFHHSMNYRSAVVHGTARTVSGSELLQALEVITERVAPGSWQHARQPTAKELAATSVLALPLAEASVKVRSGGPNDDEDDVAAARAWAGVLPLEHRWGSPQPSAGLAPGRGVPDHVGRRRPPGCG
jgi:nitroimidazol reductase NimA-like FMN-containing flavoprotein (pyridoxamine 5'-phosphate oxidase superfamily)